MKVTSLSAVLFLNGIITFICAKPNWKKCDENAPSLCSLNCSIPQMKIFPVREYFANRNYSVSI